MTNQQSAPEIYTLHTVPNKGERPWSGIYTVRADAEHDAKVMRDVTGRDWSVVRLVVADAAATPTGPIARYKIGYATDDWGMRSSTPSGIQDHAGAWVRYEDHVAALVEAQQLAPSAAAAPQGGVCDKAPAGWLCIRQHGHEGPCAAEPTLSARSEEWVEGYAAGVRDGWKDALRTQQAAPTAQADSQPAPEYVGNGMFKGETIQKAAEHWANWCDRRCMNGLAEFLRVVAARAPADSVTAPAGCGAVLEWHAPGLGEVHNESHGQLIFCTDGDDVADDTLARRVCAALNATPSATPSAASIAWNALRDLTDPLGEDGVKIMGHVRIYAQRQYEAGKEEADRAARAPADSLQEDAARWHWLAEYLVGTRTDLDDEIVASETVNDLRKLVDAARKQGGAA